MRREGRIECRIEWWIAHKYNGWAWNVRTGILTDAGGTCWTEACARAEVLRRIRAERKNRRKTLYVSVPTERQPISKSQNVYCGTKPAYLRVKAKILRNR